MKLDHRFWAVVGLSMVLRATLLVSIGPAPQYALTSDSPSYIEPARHLREDGRFSNLLNGREVPELYRTPGYPVFLLPFLVKDGTIRERAVQWAQALLNSCSAGLVYLAALFFWRSEGAALAAGAGFALDFVNAFRQVVLFLFVSCLPLAVWMVRNERAAGRLTFSTLQDANIYIVRAALVEMGNKRISYETAVENVQNAYKKSRAEEPAGRWAAQYLFVHWKEYSKLMAKDVVKLLSGNSMKVAAWAILKDDRYNPTVIPVHSSESPLSQARELMVRHSFLGGALFAYLLFLGLVYVLAAWGIWMSGREKGWGETLIVFSSIFYFAALTLGVDAQARYRLPIMPALFLFAGRGLTLCSKESRESEER